MVLCSMNGKYNIQVSSGRAILPQNALRRDCNGKCIEWIKGHYLEVVVEVYMYRFVTWIFMKVGCLQK